MKQTDSCGLKNSGLQTNQTVSNWSSRCSGHHQTVGHRHWYRRCPNVSPRLPAADYIAVLDQRSGGLKPVDLSAAPVSIFERRYFRTLLAKLSCGCGRTPEHPIARAI